MTLPDAGTVVDEVAQAAQAALLSSGEFDADWYRGHYRDVDMMGMTAAAHYLWLGRKLGRKPSENAQVASGALDPGRRATRGMGVEEPIVFYPVPSGNLTIAAVVHVFYADLIDEVCRHLLNIPRPFSGFFAVRDDAMALAMRAALDRHGLNCEAHIAVCPNRGRNFGAFLVDFRKLIRAHDLCVHVHTKKSLHSGADQGDWRDHLFHALLGNATIVSTILTRFAQDPGIGLLFPPTFEVMPVWCQHWLSSGHLVEKVAAMLGIERMPARGLIDFPAGAMFWARTRAIAPMLDFPWRYEDFEPEPLPDDGALAHALERSFTAVCRDRGFDYLEMDLGQRIYRRNWSEKLLHRHVGAWDLACRAVERCDVLSVDFDDTLFSRMAFTPEAVGGYLGWLLHRRGITAREEDFGIAREAAVSHARAADTKGDISLADIYHSFPAVCDWSPDSIAQAHALELDLEARCLAPRRDVVDLARMAKARGSRVILTCDSPLPPSFFIGVLAEHGLSDLFEGFYISSDIARRKDRGDMWPFIKEREAVGHRFLHIGDNEHADIQNANRNGLDHIYVLSTNVMADLCGLGPEGDWRSARAPWRDDIIHGPIAIHLCSNAFLHRDMFRPVALNTARDVGYVVFGPLFFGYLTWLVVHIRQRGSDSLFFPAPAGGYLMHLYEQMRRAMGGAASGLPEGRLLCIPLPSSGSCPELLDAYLFQEGVARDGVLIAGLGDAGGVQSMMQAAMEQALHGCYLIAPAHATKEGSAIGYVDGAFLREEDVQAMLNAVQDVCPWTGYAEVGGVVQPVCRPVEALQADVHWREALLDGAGAYIADLMKCYGPQIADTIFSSRECAWGWRAIADQILTLPDACPQKARPLSGRPG